MAGSSQDVSQDVSKDKGDSGPTARAQDLRNKLWAARARNSRPVGVLLLALSGIFFVLAFVTSSLPIEASSLTAFVLGALLLVSSFDQRVRIFPTAEALAGPVKLSVELLKERGWTGRANFRIKNGEVRMTPELGNPGTDRIEAVPYGHDLVRYYEAEIGNFHLQGIDFVKRWLPRVLTDSTGFAERASISTDKDEVRTRLVRPFVRPLCVDPFFTENICRTLGCPLVSSVGEALALSKGTTVTHVACSYDPLTQTATSVHKIS